MKKILLTSFLLLFFFPLFSQENNQTKRNKTIDSLYREDQFYFGFSFNLLTDLPPEVSQSGFSGGLHFGFIRDMPVNDRRNLALGLGIGLSLNTYGHNLFIGETPSGETIFQALKNDEVLYETNRVTTYLVEVPVEFRWRSSTASKYDFWRVYAGLKPGYIYYFKSNFKQPGNQVIQTKVDELSRFRLGATLAVGYSNVNFYFYYSLTPFFSGGPLLNGEEVGMKTLKIGLVFYIL